MRLRRERDVLDVVVLVTVAALGFQHLPWRDRVLVSARRALAVLVAGAEQTGFELYVAAGVAVALLFLIYLTQIVPRQG